MSRARVFTDAGVEIQCAKCKEFWPEDPEFFFFNERKGYHSWCKACYREDPKRQLTVARGIAKRAAQTRLSHSA